MQRQKGLRCSHCPSSGALLETTSLTESEYFARKLGDPQGRFSSRRLLFCRMNAEAIRAFSLLLLHCSRKREAIEKRIVLSF